LLPGLNLGRLFGVRVRADYSLLLIAALVTINLGAVVFPAWHPEWSALVCWLLGLAAALLFFASVLAHELAHALVARPLGVPVSGITLFLFGGMAHLDRDAERPRTEFLIAAVGPVTSIAIGVGALLGAAALSGVDAGAGADVDVARRAGPLATLLFWLGPLNVFLGVFNLVPGFPLDGGRMLRAVLWWATGSYLRATSVAAMVGQAVGVLLIVAGVAMVLGLAVPLFGTGSAQGVWLALVGWFLSRAARASQRQAFLFDALEGVPIARVMRSAGEVRELSTAAISRFGRVLTVAVTDSAAEALRQLERHGIEQLPVVSADGELVGVALREDLLRWAEQRSSREQREPRRPRLRSGGFRHQA
jgi:Zn-dependent protease